jgi:hypothetical protein
MEASLELCNPHRVLGASGVVELAQPCEGTAASNGFLVEKGKLLHGVFSRKKVRHVWPLDLCGPHPLSAYVLPFVGETTGNT